MRAGERLAEGCDRLHLLHSRNPPPSITYARYLHDAEPVLCPLANLYDSRTRIILSASINAVLITAFRRAASWSRNPSVLPTSLALISSTSFRHHRTTSTHITSFKSNITLHFHQPQIPDLHRLHPPICVFRLSRRDSSRFETFPVLKVVHPPRPLQVNGNTWYYPTLQN